MHTGGNASLVDPQWNTRRWNGAQAYADSKLFDVVLAFAVARRWPRVFSNALEPGWVPTKMGGPSAPDDLSLAPVTQAWLAVSDDPAARVTGASIPLHGGRICKTNYWPTAPVLRAHLSQTNVEFNAILYARKEWIR